MVVGQEEEKTSQRYPLSFFLCHAIFMTALIMKQGNHSSEVIDKVAFMETYQDREAP